MTLDELLSRLTLLRNDPELAEAIRPYAEEGDVDAQYAMGLIYAEGRGVPTDPARAHYWLSLAADQGDRDAVTLRNVVGCQMNESEYRASVRMRSGTSLRSV